MTYTEFLYTLADDNGTISYLQAELSAILHNLKSDFINDYEHMEGQRIDAAEYLMWLGY